MKMNSLLSIGVAICFGLLTACAPQQPPKTTVDLDELIPAQPPGALIERGELMLERGELVTAENSFREALRLDAQNRRAQLGLAEAALAGGDVSRAAGQLASLNPPDDDNADPMIEARIAHARSMVALRQDDLSTAEQQLGIALELDPGHWPSWNTLGIVLDRQSRHPEAQEAFLRALEIAPGIAAIYNNLGMSLMAVNDHNGALDAFRQAIIRAPELLTPRTNMRIALAGLGRYDEALAGIPPGQNADVLNNVGFVALLNGHYGRAESLFVRAMQESPSFHQPSWSNLVYLRGLNRGGEPAPDAQPPLSPLAGRVSASDASAATAPARIKVERVVRTEPLPLIPDAASTTD